MGGPRELRAIDIDKVLRHDLGHLSLTEVEPNLRKSLNIFLVILEHPHESSEDTLLSAQRGANELEGQCRRALAMSISDGNLSTVRNDILMRFRSVWGKASDLRAHAMAIRLQDLESEADRIRALSDDVIKLKEAAQVSTKAAEEAAHAAIGSAQVKWVVSLTDAFEQERKKCEDAARLWVLIATGMLLGGAFLLGVYVEESFRYSNYSVARAIIRVVVIAAVFGAFQMAIRQYQAFRHMEAVNSHRVNIGKSFHALHAAQVSERARDIMAALTTENMLVFGKSGLIPKDTTVQSPGYGTSDLLRGLFDQKDQK